jgi:hypothetical protein
LSFQTKPSSFHSLWSPPLSVITQRSHITATHTHSLSFLLSNTHYTHRHSL